jgi:hypothetical protein
VVFTASANAVGPVPEGCVVFTASANAVGPVPEGCVVFIASANAVGPGIIQKAVWYSQLERTLCAPVSFRRLSGIHS